MEFKRYFDGISDVGTRLLFKFRSGTHGVNEELHMYIGRHKGRNGMTECILCGDECESAVRVLWECPAKDLLTRIVGKRWLGGREEVHVHVHLVSLVTGGE